MKGVETQKTNPLAILYMATADVSRITICMPVKVISVKIQSVQIRQLGPLLHDSSEDNSGALLFQSLGSHNDKM